MIQGLDSPRNHSGAVAHNARRILKMLGARGSHVAASRTPKTETAAEAAVTVVEIRGIEPLTS